MRDKFNLELFRFCKQIKNRLSEKSQQLAFRIQKKLFEIYDHKLCKYPSIHLIQICLRWPLIRMAAEAKSQFLRLFGSNGKNTYSLRPFLPRFIFTPLKWLSIKFIITFDMSCNRWIYVAALLLHSPIFAADFDYAVIGTTPISLFEALYQHYRGQRVVILEADTRCGGAWKSIDICGIRNVDMGCHELSSTPEMNRFLEDYTGCRMILWNDNYYFSKGCQELVKGLLDRIQAAQIPLYTECLVENALLDVEKKQATLVTAQGEFTAEKMIVTPGSRFLVNEIPMKGKGPHKFYHLYLLIEDPTPHRFSYRHGGAPGILRMMNLTTFVELESTQQQLIVIQIQNEEGLDSPETLFETLKQANLLDKDATLLKSEPFIFEQGPYFQLHQLQHAQRPFFEILNTSHISMIKSYMFKWQKILPPFER